MNLRRIVVFLFVVLLCSPLLAQTDPTKFDFSAGNPKLIDEIDCSKPNKDLLFIEYPAGISKVETVLDTPVRLLPNKEGDGKFFAYRIGEGKGLKAGAAYILQVEYPEDASRSLWICNWGCETALGFATGQAIGDVLNGKYVPNNPESLKYPLSGKMETWNQFFYLHDRFPEIKRPREKGPRPLLPEDGFWVVIAQPPAVKDPLSNGAAVSKIRLFEIQNPEALNVPLNLPPEGLPRRHIFSREEMADGVIATGHSEAEKDPSLRGVKDLADWYEYKMRVMQFLGINTFSKDLLEFGHNQGWDSSEGGGNDWVYQSSNPELWEQVLDRAAKLKVTVLPNYEYRGSVGANKEMAVGPNRRAKRLDGGDSYTQLDWLEVNNADIVDPATLDDLKKILDLSLVKYKSKVPMVGAWIRQRPTAMPVSFSDKNIRLFSTEANDGQRITRSHLQTDKALLEKYYAWWFDKRKEFYIGVRDYLREKVSPEAFVLYTGDSSEPGRPLPRSITGEGQPDLWTYMQCVVNDDPTTWEPILSNHDKYPYYKNYPFQTVVDKDMHLRAHMTWAENYDKWESAHATPPDDPDNYKDLDGIMLSYTYNRLYTVGSTRTFDPYRTKEGLALVRHYSLNENEMTFENEEKLGYFMIDVERGGAYCMMAEARAMAWGDPRILGSLTGNSNKRGFPQYVRNFHANFLALPALPSKILESASSDPEVVVRSIPTEKNGTYYAIVNTSFQPKEVTITLPAGGKLVDATNNQPVAAEGGKLTLTLYPAQLRSLHAQ